MSPKFAFALSALAAASAAHAVTFNFQSNGSATYSPGPNTVAIDNTTAATPTPLTQYMPGTTAGYSFVGLYYAYVPTFVGNSRTGTVAGSGTLTLSDPSSSLGTFTFSFSGTAKRSVLDGMNDTLVNVSFSNLSIALAGTGAFLGSAGIGSFSGNKSGLQGELSTTTFVSEFQAVPEPSSFAALAIGGFGLLGLRRRRR